MKTRTMKLKIENIECSTGWASSALTFIDYRGENEMPRKVILAIEDPSDVRYIRRRLDEIEAYWRKTLETRS